MTRILATLAAAMLLGSCGGDQAPPVDAARVLREGGAAMGQLKTVSATLKLTKGTISLQGFTLVSAKTAVRLPTDSDTVYTVKQQDITFAVQVVIAGAHVYVKLPFSTFQEAPPTQAAAFPDMAKLFDSATGLPVVIPAGAGPKYVSTDQVDGASAYRVSTSYSADQVHGLLSELSSSGPVSANVWVDVSDHLVRKAVLDGAFGDGGTRAVVEVDITGFNSAVSITSPTPTP
jgi:hypothetical protein